MTSHRDERVERLKTRKTPPIWWRVTSDASSEGREAENKKDATNLVASDVRCWQVRPYLQNKIDVTNLVDVQVSVLVGSCIMETTRERVTSLWTRRANVNCEGLPPGGSTKFSSGLKLHPKMIHVRI